MNRKDNDKINEYTKTVCQLFWSKGITDAMYMFVSVMDALYMRRKSDFEISSFGKHEKCVWGNLMLLDKQSFQETYIEHIIPFLMDQKNIDLRCVDYHASSSNVREFAAHYELFHLTDDLFEELRQDYNECILYGVVIEVVMDSLGIQKSLPLILKDHIAKLMSLLLDVNIYDTLFVPNCGIGNLIIQANNQVLALELPENEKVKDVDGFDTLDRNVERYSFIAKNHLFHSFATEKNRDLAYICAMNLYLHGVELNGSLANNDYWSPTFVNQHKSKFSKILSLLMERNTTNRIMAVESILEMLKSKGKAAVIVPESFLFSRESKMRDLRKKLLNNNFLEAVVSLPNGIISNSRVKTSLLILSKRRTVKNDTVWFCELLNDGYANYSKHVRNESYPLPHLVECFKNKVTENENFMNSRNVHVSDILKNEGMLAINYYKEYDPTPPIVDNPLVALKDLMVLESKIKTGLDDLYKIL